MTGCFWKVVWVGGRLPQEPLGDDGLHGGQSRSPFKWAWGFWPGLLQPHFGLHGCYGVLSSCLRATQ